MDDKNAHFLSNCRLCIEINDFENSLFYKKYSKILIQNCFFERSQIQVMIPIGPYCLGHLLIASKQHEWSFGHIGKDIIPEVLDLVNDVSSFLKKHFKNGRIIVFEHGPLSSVERGGACLSHAHFNVLPIPDIFPLYEKASKHHNFKPIKFHQLEDFIKRGEAYLFFHCPLEGTFAAPAPIGSTQFFRKLLASSDIEGNWDWRTDPKVDIVQKMAELLKDL